MYMWVIVRACVRACLKVLSNNSGTKMPKQIGPREDKNGTEGLLKNRNRIV